MAQTGFLNSDSFLVLERLSQKKCYLRELAEELGFSPSYVHKLVSRLLQNKMIVAEKQKNRKLLGLDYASPLARRSLSLVFIKRILGCKSLRKLIKLGPKSVLLFGSAASGRITANSDVDLAVFFEKMPDFLELSEIERRLSSELKREVQLVFFTLEEWRKSSKQDMVLYDEIKFNSVLIWGKELERS